MNGFWNWLLKFMNEHWQDLILGAGILFNCLRTPKTAEEKKEAKRIKAHTKSEKCAKKLSKALDKESSLEGEIKTC